ncbi:MAG: hypothetical protein J6K45_04645 [Clostridia bacterium]|nr:hypothetical protein [Clostridia bacterium]
MANEQNLMPIEQVNSRRSREEHSKDSAKGGKKSGEVRRKRKAMKEQMDLLLSLPFNLKDSKGNAVVDTLEFLGIDKDQIDNQMAIVISLWKTAMNSNSAQQINAVREIREIVKDENTIDDDDRVQIINDLPKDGEYEES